MYSQHYDQLVRRIRRDVEGKLADDIIKALNQRTRESPRLQVVEYNNTLVRRGVTLKVSRKALSAVKRLNEGGVVSVHALRRAVYGAKAQERSINVIRVLINELRPRLKRLNVEITNHWGVGYELIQK